jgi:hypothetical protein
LWRGVSVCLSLDALGERGVCPVVEVCLVR